jgi:lipoprotein NlpD
MPGPRSEGRIRIATLVWLLLVASTVVAGCGGHARRHRAPDYYTVREGDTLYSIGWRYGLDYHDIARWNGIGRGYHIFVGQRLRLGPSSGGVVAQGSGTARPGVPRTRAPPAKLPPAPPWVWPVSGGQVVGPVTQPSGGVGLRVDGSLGQPILAAADGKVVYTGTGLLGYGVVVIINHVNGWLTAYGHNATVLVHDGDAVRAGQAIATMGLGAGQQPMLYFEIRIEGAPVDPLSQLPRR